MAQKLPSDEEQSIATLLGEIIHDVQKLMRQELVLARTEVQSEWIKAKAAAVVFAAGAVGLGLGGVLLAFALVYLLQVITGLTLWLCFGIFSVVFAGVGVMLLLQGKKKSGKVDFIPHGTIESVKENMQWIRSQT